MDSAHVTDVASRYANFGTYEVRGRNPVYSAWAEGVAEDPEISALISELPPLRRQPVLLFAAARFAGAAESTDYPEFREFLRGHWARVAEIAMTHSTQTNEAKRTACLLPFFSAAAASSARTGTISLVEAGASAGLCLYPDRYHFRYRTEGSDQVTEIGATPRPPSPSTPDDDGGVSFPAPVLDCDVRGMIAPPRTLPEVLWRGGVDLNPLDPADPDNREWLKALIWPGQPERAERLALALDIAAAEPAHILAGDLVERTGEAVAAARKAAPDTTPVVFHTAVLAYLEPGDREKFSDTMRELSRDYGVVWIANEGVTILPRVAEKVPPAVRKNKGIFVIAVNETPLATTHGHGDWVRSLEP